MAYTAQALNEWEVACSAAAVGAARAPPPPTAEVAAWQGLVSAPLMVAGPQEAHEEEKAAGQGLAVAGAVGAETMARTGSACKAAAAAEAR